jgi:hypothetical protein
MWSLMKGHFFCVTKFYYIHMHLVYILVIIGKSCLINVTWFSMFVNWNNIFTIINKLFFIFHKQTINEYNTNLYTGFMISVQVNWDNIGKNLNILPLKIIKLIFYYVKFEKLWRRTIAATLLLSLVYFSSGFCRRLWNLCKQKQRTSSDENNSFDPLGQEMLN